MHASHWLNIPSKCYVVPWYFVPCAEHCLHPIRKLEVNLLQNIFCITRSNVDGPPGCGDPKRLRIDQVDFRNLIVDDFATPELAFLKILMLYPRPPNPVSA